MAEGVVLGGPTSAGDPWTSDPLQLRLRSELELKMAPWIAQIYQEAIRALGDASGPERLAICCYLLRELIDAIPNHFIKKSVDPVSAGPVIDWIQSGWNALAAEPGRVQKDNSWRSEPWKPVSDFLRSLGQRLIAYRDDYPKKRELRGRAFAFLDPRVGAMNKDELKAYMKTVEDFEGYFNSVLHHGKSDADECAAQVASFERYLGDLLNPPVFFTNRTIIAQLVKEAERANS